MIITKYILTHKGRITIAGHHFLLFRKSSNWCSNRYHLWPLNVGSFRELLMLEINCRLLSQGPFGKVERNGLVRFDRNYLVMDIVSQSVGPWGVLVLQASPLTLCEGVAYETRGDQPPEWKILETCTNWLMPFEGQVIYGTVHMLLWSHTYF